jgi:hypothetical protein
MLTGHGDYHPAFGRSFSAAVDLRMDSPSSMLGGEAFLERVFNAYRSATTETGSLPHGRVLGVLRDIVGHFFPLLAGDAKDRR